MLVFVTSPWIPAEWIRAHGHEPRGVWFEKDFSVAAPALSAGVCAFAERVIRFAESRPDCAVVFTTACDQMRRGFDAAAFRGNARTFLFNLPATQTPAAKQKSSAVNSIGSVNSWCNSAERSPRPKRCRAR